MSFKERYLAAKVNLLVVSFSTSNQVLVEIKRRLYGLGSLAVRTGELRKLLICHVS